MRKNKTLTKVGLLSSTLLLSGLAGVINSEYDVSAILANQGTETVSVKDTYVFEENLADSAVDSKVETFSYDKQVDNGRGELKLPRTSVTYTVKAGDNLYRIGQNHGGITAEQIKAWNGLTSDNIQVGQVLFLGPKTNTAWDNSQKDPDAINNDPKSSNYWKKTQTLYRNGGNETWIETSGKYLSYGINPYSIVIAEKELTFSGFAAQVNYTHTTYGNSDTYIVFEEANSNGDAIKGGSVKWFETSHVSGTETSGPFEYNAIHGTPTLKCATGQSSSFDTHPDWNKYGSVRSTTVGCLHNFKDSGFSAKIPLESLFGEGKDNIKYNMYVVNRTGKDRVLYAKIQTTVANKKNYSAPKTMGDIHFNKDKENPQVRIHQGGYYWLRKAPNNADSSVYNAYSYFNSGWHDVNAVSLSNTDDPGMLYYRLNTNWYSGRPITYIAMPFVEYPENIAQLEYVVSAQKYKINRKYYSIEQGKELSELSSVEKHIAVGDTHNIPHPDTYWKDSTSYYPWGSQATTRKFGNPYPADVNQQFVTGSPLKKNYRRNSDNGVIKTDTVWAVNGKLMTEKAPEQFQSGSTWYLIDNAKSTVTQTRQFTEAIAKSKKTLDDINWYYNSELPVKVNYMNENMSVVLQSYNDKVPYRSSKTFTAPMEIVVSGETYLYRPHLTPEDKNNQDRKIERKSVELEQKLNDVNFVYDNEIPVRVNYYDTDDKLLQTKVVQVKANKTYTETAQKIVIGGKTYRYQPSDARNKGTTQSRTFAYKTENLADINFYLDEEIDVMVTHAKYDYTGNSTVFYSSPKFGLIPGETVPLSEQDAFGINHRVRHNALGSDYFFAGRGLDETGKLVKHPESTHDIVDGNYKTPLKKGAKDYTVTFYYMKEIKNPSIGETDIKQNSKDSSNPNMVIPPGYNMPDVNSHDYNGIITGQTNWYLSKDPTVTNSNPKESYVSINSIINEFGGEPLAVRNVNNQMRVGSGYVFDKKPADTYYNKGFIAAREVIQFIGEGKEESLIPQRTDNKPVSNVKDVSRLREEASHSYNMSPSMTKAVKGQDFVTDLSYEYSNKLRDIYSPSDSFIVNGVPRVFQWQYQNTEIVWENSDTYFLRHEDSLDFDLDNTIDVYKRENGSFLNGVFHQKIGEYRTYTNHVASDSGFEAKLDNNLSESFDMRELADNDTLDSQRKIKISGVMTYTNPLRTGTSPVYRTFGNRNPLYNGNFVYNARDGVTKYYMPDVDENFRNVNSVDDEDGATLGKRSTDHPKTGVPVGKDFQLGVYPQREGTVSGTDENIRIATNYKYTIGKDTGFLAEVFSYGNVNQYYNEKFEDYFDIAPSVTDTPIYDTAEDWYYLPVDAKSSLKPETSHENHMYLEDMGLSQVSVKVIDRYEFSNYLVGSPMDEPEFNVQKEPLKDGNYEESVVIDTETKKAIKEVEESRTTKNASSVRKTDSYNLFDKLKEKLGW